MHVRSLPFRLVRPAAEGHLFLVMKELSAALSQVAAYVGIAVVTIIIVASVGCNQKVTRLHCTGGSVCERSGRL